MLDVGAAGVLDQQEIFVSSLSLCYLLVPFIRFHSIRVSFIYLLTSIFQDFLTILIACAPQPTEDSSSSPADGGNNYNGDGMNAILSDSDDRQELKLSLKARQSCLFGNFESDSLNENFSPARYVL